MVRLTFKSFIVHQVFLLKTHSDFVGFKGFKGFLSYNEHVGSYDFYDQQKSDCFLQFQVFSLFFCL